MADANFNADITVNLYTTAQAVERAVFGAGAIATDDVEVGFSETYRLYESNTELQADDDVSTAGKAQGAAYFAQDQHPKKLFILSVDYNAGGTELGTSLDAAYADIREAGEDFYGLCCASRLDADWVELGTWAAANSKLVFGQSDDADTKDATDPNPLSTMAATSNKHFVSVWHDDDAEYADIAWMAKVLAADPDQRATVAYDKTLTGITAPTGLTSTNKTNIIADGGNLYLPFFGNAVMRPGKASDGSWIDSVILGDWVKARIAEDIAQYLQNQSSLGRKVPYTAAGIAEIAAVIRSRLLSGVQLGHFDADTVYVTEPDIDTISAATKATRLLTIEAGATEAGGIYGVTCNVGIEV